MNRFISVAFLFASVCLHITSLSAQKKKLPEQILKVSLADFYLSTATVNFEKVMNDRMSLQLGGSATYQHVSLWEELKGTFSGFAVSPELRYYGRPYYSIMIEPIAPVGIYLSAWGRYEKARMTINTATEKVDILNGSAYAGGLLFGWQFWVKFNRQPRFLLDFGLGGGYRFTDYGGRFAEKGRLIAFKQRGILPKISFCAGLPF